MISSKWCAVIGLGFLFPMIVCAAALQEADLASSKPQSLFSQFVQRKPEAVQPGAESSKTNESSTTATETVPAASNTTSQQSLTPSPVEPQVPSNPVSPMPNKTDTAYRSLLESALPLSPDQIIQLHRLYDLTQRAAAAPPTSPPLPVSSSLMVNLEPGSAPPLVRLSAGFVTSLVFVDSTGAPWPITAYGIGDPSSFNIQWDQLSNTLFVQSLKPYSHGNLAIRLVDLNTPIMVSLVSGQKEVDYRVDLQVSGRGPNATAPILPNSTLTASQVNPMMIQFLDGVPPESSQALSVNPNIGQAWLGENQRVYLRTPYTVLSPAWNATISSPNGTRVYELPKTPLVLISQEGKTTTVEIKGL